MHNKYQFFIGPSERPLDTSEEDGAGYYAMCLNIAIEKLEQTNNPEKIKNITHDFIANMKVLSTTREMITQSETNLKILLNSTTNKKTIIDAMLGMPVPDEGYVCLTRERPA